MIFVTVGTQLPFDRMVQTIDQWAGAQSFGDVFAQIGPAKYKPKHIPWTQFLDADECRRKIEQADVVVAHAGMGSILTALQLGKPILVMPRLSALGEHRNDHQLATAKRLLAQGRIIVAFDEGQLLEKLSYFRALRPTERIDIHASSTLLTALRAFVDGEKVELPVNVRQPGTFSANVATPLDDGVEAAKNESAAWRVTADVAPFTWDRDIAGDSCDIPNRRGLRFGRGERSSIRTIHSGLVAVILLAGRLRLTDLAKRIGRSRLDLPIDSNRSLLTYWRDETAKLADSWDCRNLAMRVLLDQASATPTLPAGVPGIEVSVERDRAEFRGTGGVLRDVCSGYDDDAWVLVANAAQVHFEPLHEAADRLAEAGGEVNVVNESDGIPNGLILLKCGVLRAVSEVGFHDMKEQVVPTMAGRRQVKVVCSSGSTSSPIHSLKDYIATLRRYHSRREDWGRHSGSFEERWQPRFSIREQGAVVAPSAVIRDSVVLEGAAVERGSVIVRSVVGRGAHVAAGQVLIDQIVQ
jgi:UDP-N-acetylglucosamine transferase subunit ALG13